MTRRSLRALLAAAALATGVLAGACTPAAPAAPGPATCPTAGAGQIQVKVVVEGTTVPNGRVVCVVVRDGATGLDALAARAQRLGTAAPRVEGGFICAIDGTPAAPECAPSLPDGFRYWAYWLGGTAWTSAPVGAGSRALHQGDVDGWVFGTWDFATTFPAPPSGPADFASIGG